MADFFLELFSEEIPANLQKSARSTVLDSFKKLFEEKQLTYKKSLAYSTPNRLIILFEGLVKEITQKSEEVRGPNTNAPEKALEGFLRSNNVDKHKIYKKKIEKGEFYFFKKEEKKTQTIDLLEKYIPQILEEIPWKKSMRWGDYSLNWARPLKSILGVFDNKKLTFNFYHLKCSNITFVDKEFEEKTKIFKNFKQYKSYFKKLGIIIDQNLRKNFIEKELHRISKKKKIFIEINKKFLEKV